MSFTDLTQLLDLEDHRVAFIDSGPRTPSLPLVFLHSGGINRRMWQPQLQAFPDRRILALDARGHGQTPNPGNPYRLNDDVVALLDALDIEQAVLIGCSMGGATSIDLALEHPPRVRAVVTCGAGTSEPEFTDPWVLSIFNTWAEAEAAGDAEAWREAFMRFVHGPHRQRDEVTPSVIEHVESMVRTTLSTHITPHYERGAAPTGPPASVTNTWERLADIDIPVLAMVGSDDSQDHYSMTRKLAEAVRLGEHAIIDDTAHYPNLERPQEFNARLTSFLQKHQL